MECVIRRWRPEDSRSLAKNLSNKKILDNLRDGLPYPYTEADAEAYISAMLAADSDKAFPFAITLDDEAVGSIGAFRCENIHSRTAELGYYIGEEYWGKGYMTSAVRQLCAYVFENTDILRIFAEPFSYNVASCRVLEKAGFQREGVIRRAFRKNGSVQDLLLFGLLKNE